MAVRTILRAASASGHARSILRRGLAGYAENVCDLIGQTPMVKLNRVVPEESVASKVLLKLEMQNPGGSIKDRIALSMIESAEARGEISPERTTIVEATSGNTGIGLAMVAAARGYKCVIVMPQVPAICFPRDPMPARLSTASPSHASVRAERAAHRGRARPTRAPAARNRCPQCTSAT